MFRCVDSNIKLATKITGNYKGHIKKLGNQGFLCYAVCEVECVISDIAFLEGMGMAGRWPCGLDLRESYLSLANLFQMITSTPHLIPSVLCLTMRDALAYFVNL